MAMMCSLFARLQNWWTITFYTWFASVAIFFFFFALLVIRYELEAAWLIVKELDDNKREVEGSGAQRFSDQNRFWQVYFFLTECVLRRQHAVWSGKQNKVRVSSVDNEELEPSHFLTTRLYTKMTLSKCGRCLFDKVDPPEKIFSMEEILGTRRFLTQHNWSMERVLCSNRKSQSIVVVQGPSALKKGQVISSVVCVLLAIVGILLLVISFLVWLEKSAVVMVIFALLIMCCCFPRIQTMFRVLRAYRQVEDHVEDSEKLDKFEDGIYQSFETYRVSRPKKAFRYALFAVNVGFFFIWPTVTLAVIGERL